MEDTKGPRWSTSAVTNEREGYNTVQLEFLGRDGGYDIYRGKEREVERSHAYASASTRYGTPTLATDLVYVFSQRPGREDIEHFIVDQREIRERDAKEVVRHFMARRHRDHVDR